jgi:hypothetical protein
VYCLTLLSNDIYYLYYILLLHISSTHSYYTEVCETVSEGACGCAW